MNELNPELKQQIEDILRKKRIGIGRSKRKELQEAWFSELLDEAFEIEDPPNEDKVYLTLLFDSILTDLPIQDAMVLVFNLGRVYQKRCRADGIRSI